MSAHKKAHSSSRHSVRRRSSVRRGFPHSNQSPAVPCGKETRDPGRAAKCIVKLSPRTRKDFVFAIGSGSDVYSVHLKYRSRSDSGSRVDVDNQFQNSTISRCLMTRRQLSIEFQRVSSILLCPRCKVRRRSVFSLTRFEKGCANDDRSAAASIEVQDIELSRVAPGVNIHRLEMGARKQKPSLSLRVMRFLTQFAVIGSQPAPPGRGSRLQRR